VISDEMNIVGADPRVRPFILEKASFRICQNFRVSKYFAEINFGVSMIFH